MTDAATGERATSTSAGTRGGVAAAPSGEGAPVLRLLLVEDDDGDALLVEELLEEVPLLLAVVRVRTMAQARAELATGYACVLLDLGLPDASGLEAIAEVLDAAGPAAVVCLTGSSDEHRGAAAVAAGAQDYLVKGTVDAPLLHRAIRYAVERRRADEAARQLLATRVRAQENARLERGLLPQPVITDPRLTATTRYRPGRGSLLGGDFYDVVETDDGTLLAVVGDVAGHGPDEAALGVYLRIAWRVLVLAGTPPERLLGLVEDVLVRERRSEEVFTTACMLAVAPDRRRARVWVAGHPDPLLLAPSATSAVATHRTDGLPTVWPAPVPLAAGAHGSALGLLPDSRWDPVAVDLPPAWRVLVFTDGLVEGRVGTGPARLGTDGLVDVLVDLDAAAAEDGALLDALLGRVRVLNGGPLSDDVAALLLSGRSDA